MPLRLRLTIWFGLLTGVVAIIVAMLTYTVHARAHYDDTDQRLAEVGQAYVEASQAGGAAQLGIGHPTVAVRLYDPDGNVSAATDDASLVPMLQPQAVLADPDGPAYDALVRLLPFSPVSIDKGAGEFGIVESGDDRWRIYVAPLGDGEGFVLTAVDLTRLDESMGLFRLLVIGLLAVGGVVTVGGGWLLAGLALRPVGAVTSTAATIAQERAFDRRVAVESSDEIGRLAATFNEMLDNLEETYRRELRFVGDASHELRAPLTAIQADLQLLESRPDMDAEMREQIVTSATREIRRLTSLVNDLLALARADAGLGLELQPVELDRVLLDALNEIRGLAGDHELRVDELTPVMIDGRRDRLVQLVIILLDNAIKYTPPGGLIAVSLRAMSEGAELSVRDTGVGIPEHDLPHVFERLYRADPARSRDPGGTGLGLSIARWIVDQHHATIDIESEVGTGTLVRVMFPQPGAETI